MNDEDIQKTAELLSRLEPGFLPYPIFEQVARLVALPILEVIPLRLSDDGTVEVLLIERSPDDPLWPHALHTPGTVIRATDMYVDGKNHWEALRRINEEELRNTPVSSPHFVGSMLHESKRGTEYAQLYWVEVTGEPAVGAFYSVDALPEAVIQSQIDFIQQAAANFRSASE